MVQVTQRLFPWTSGGEELAGFTVTETRSDSAVLNQCCTKGTTVNHILCSITYLEVLLTGNTYGFEQTTKIEVILQT